MLDSPAARIDRMAQLADLLDDDAQSVSDDGTASTAADRAVSNSRFASLSFVFLRESQRGEDLFAFHPASALLPVYWQVYCDNCESIMRLIHAPSVSVIIKDAQKNLRVLKADAEALLFAIYFAAVISLGEEEALRTLGADRATLLNRYETAFQKAIKKVGLAYSKDIKGLQALVLYIVSARATVFDSSTHSPSPAFGIVMEPRSGFS